MQSQVLPSADLSVSLTASPEPILAGHDLTYTYRVTNTGPSPRPASCSPRSYPRTPSWSPGPTPATATIVSGDPTTPLIIQIGDMASGAVVTGTFTLRPMVLAGNANSRLLTNKVNVDGNESDPNAANDSATVVTTVSPADLS